MYAPTGVKSEQPLTLGRGLIIGACMVYILFIHGTLLYSEYCHPGQQYQVNLQMDIYMRYFQYLV